MSARDRTSAARRLEMWLWTGPIGHLAGGALDLGKALARAGTRAALARARARVKRAAAR